MSEASGFRLSRQAERDLREIEEYSSRQWGNEKSAEYVQDIFSAFRKLVLRPDLGRTRKDIAPPYLVFSVGSHLIIYRVHHTPVRIDVLNIVHPAMNVQKRVVEALKQKRG